MSKAEEAAKIAAWKRVYEAVMKQKTENNWDLSQWNYWYKANEDMVNEAWEKNHALRQGLTQNDKDRENNAEDRKRFAKMKLEREEQERKFKPELVEMNKRAAELEAYGESIAYHDKGLKAAQAAYVKAKGELSEATLALQKAPIELARLENEIEEANHEFALRTVRSASRLQDVALKERTIQGQYRAIGERNAKIISDIVSHPAKVAELESKIASLENTIADQEIAIKTHQEMIGTLNAMRAKDMTGSHVNRAIVEMNKKHALKEAEEAKELSVANRKMGDLNRKIEGADRKISQAQQRFDEGHRRINKIEDEKSRVLNAVRAREYALNELRTRLDQFSKVKGSSETLQQKAEGKDKERIEELNKQALDDLNKASRKFQEALNTELEVMQSVGGSVGSLGLELKERQKFSVKGKSDTELARSLITHYQTKTSIFGKMIRRNTEIDERNAFSKKLLGALDKEEKNAMKGAEQDKKDIIKEREKKYSLLNEGEGVQAELEKFFTKNAIKTDKELHKVDKETAKKSREDKGLGQMKHKVIEGELHLELERAANAMKQKVALKQEIDNIKRNIYTVKSESNPVASASPQAKSVRQGGQER